MKLSILHLRFLLITLLTLSLYLPAKATHFYGADLFYTHQGGNLYRVTFVAYGDCGGSAFPSFPSSTVGIDIYNGTSFTGSISLSLQPPFTGEEVTPVCQAQKPNTNCVNPSGTVPGVTKFTYAGNATIVGTSANWRFVFEGDMGASQAGRSTTLTNISNGTGGSIMALEATLNNTLGANSSPVFTTIPTPFFCINKPASYNPGSVDPNGNTLSYALVNGLEPLGTVPYVAGFSGANPLLSAVGSFNFTTTTGQLNFTPNAVQRALVVTKTSEYNGTTLVGTCMREMTFVVLNNCNNNPPNGGVTNSSGGTIVTPISVNACQNNTLSFNINPTDADGNAINVVATGIPAGASFTITGNNTTTPSGSFNWNLIGVTPGNYTFYVTYTDDGCPLSSKQTTAYTVTVLPMPGISYALVSPATCTKKARFNITPAGIGPWNFTVLQGSTIIHTITNITNPQLDSLAPGTYTMRITAANGCWKDTLITIASPAVIIPSVSMVKPSCFGGSNGSITVSATGGLAPFEYAIGTGTFSTSNVFNGLSAGSHTVRVKDANNCIKDTIVLLLDNAPININVNVARPTCNAISSGAITVIASSGVAPYQYAIGPTNPFGATNTFGGLSGGTYLLRVKDANGCLASINYVLNDSITVRSPATVTHVLCYGDATGAITLNAHSGTPPYKYKLGTGPLTTTNTFTGLIAGSYNFHIEDVNGCYLDTTVVVNQPTRLGSTSVVNHVSCFGFADASIVITGFGGVLPYTYSFGAAPYSSVNTFGGLAVGSYTLHVKDGNNCIRDTTITITQPAKLLITNIAEVQPVCNGDANGTYTITLSGGTTPYSYTYNANPFGSSNVLTGVPAGTHTIHIKDFNGCLVDSVRTMLEPTPIIPTVPNLRNSTCATLGDGHVTIAATGGVPPYTYAVNASAYSASPAFTNLAAGFYVFHIKDTRGCIKDTIISLIDSLNPDGVVTVTDASCFDESTGIIGVAPFGAQAPYQFAINAGTYGTASVFNNLHANTYTIHIKDANGCIKSLPATVNEPTLLVPAVTVVNQPCFGYNVGTITITATGGTPNYSFALNSGSFGTTNSFGGLVAGTYTVRVRDSKGCQNDTPINLTQPSKVIMQSLTVTNPLCFGDSNGTATIIGVGGVPPYQYRSNYGAFQASNQLTTLYDGNNMLRIQDANGCFMDSLVVLTQPSALKINNAEIVSPTCADFADGSVKLNVDGGTPPYLYHYGELPKQSSATLTKIYAGEYLFTITDNNGCRKDTTIKLTGYPAIVINSIIPKNISCYGRADGGFDIEATGGIPALRYSIGSVQTFDPSFRNLAVGSHNITITDAKGCTKDTAANVLMPDALTTKLTATNNDCEGYDNGGSITADVKGGTEPYNYSWSVAGSANNKEIRGVANGSYNVVITDANACTDTALTTIIYDNCCKIFIPDAFTPNGDGLNDKVRILFKGDMQLEQFYIVNRFGQVVFSSNNVAEGWDGSFKGVQQDIGTYNYYAKIICGNAGTNEQEYKGTITLIR
jgi:hypothetical protein